MQKWEYSVIANVTLPASGVVELLNTFGLDGWELCSVLDGWDKQTVIYHFKRMIS